ncbi:membrane protein insertase YidC [Quadrisphaera sp. DSM 44207]|uniref:membrane protein insertase YidC n=1 Tax=Quadrisphaera sp. DSM 44207 TaxID=1881057 RepID=UPI00088B6B69|nr:membrane protein insertase YidC [Quadrisphaera sp. DSM 44207]SDQ23228.1 YidC/Oxa1 family membrane protein insertase [Quadrisphaera sp. DSM 44207]
MDAIASLFRAIGDFFLALFYPIELAVAWIMVRFHDLLTAMGMAPESGWTWALSIVGLVVVIRILLIPLFVKQIKASRGMALVQPEMRKLQQKYKGKTDPASREAMSREMMELYRHHGTNPFASCLPILLQAPIFFALFRVLNTHIRDADGIGALTGELAQQAAGSTLFGARLVDTFLGSDDLNVRILTIVLIVLMSATMFITQRQLMMKNMPASALDNPFAQQQKILLYAFPIIFAVTGVNFPIGVLIYWLTTNLWTGGQQFYVIRRMPAPGSQAERALQERRARKGRGAPAAEAVVQAQPVVKGQRVQPKRKDRARPSRPSPSGPGRSGSGAAPASGATPASGTAGGVEAPGRARATD